MLATLRGCAKRTTVLIAFVVISKKTEELPWAVTELIFSKTLYLYPPLLHCFMLKCFDIASFSSSYSALHIQVSFLISFYFVFHASHLRIEDLCFLS